MPPQSDGNVLTRLGQGRRERCSLGRFQHKNRFSCKQLQSCHRNELQSCLQHQRRRLSRRAGAELKRGAGSLSKPLGHIAPLPGGDWM